MASTTVCAHGLLLPGVAVVDSSRHSGMSSTRATASLGCEGGARSCDGPLMQQHSAKMSCAGGPVTDVMGLSSVSGMRLSLGTARNRWRCRTPKSRVVSVRASGGNGVVGENPDWSEEDSLVVGLAHCFVKNADQKLSEVFVVEPIPAGGLECMDNGGVTCYKHVTGTNLGTVLKQDLSLLPSEFRVASFCEDFDFRAKCASRTWKRDHPQEKLLHLVPWNGSVRSDFNFSLVDKRILNQENIVKDSDNIKQDMSIDVYGRTDSEEEMTAEIGQLYNV